ncbi:UDP-glucose 4-epimerase [Roseobacter sp. AzwK-3b]|nr:UDP-glucose 4-epimerase [Roseobacter sp. AzwK-3b]
MTGGAGYIGSHAVLSLLGAGHDVLIVDSFATSSPRVIKRLEALSGRVLHVIERDVRDYEAMRGVMASWVPEAVIHFAGLKSVAESVADPALYYDVNVGGTVSLLRAMAEIDCSKIVFSSSATVYGTPEYLPYDEAHPTNPVNPYGRTKLVVEQLLGDWIGAREGRAVTALRYFNPVGAHPSGEIGEDPSGVPNNLMPYIAQVAVGRRPHLTIFGDDYETRDGTGERDYIHVMDLAEAHVAALMHLATGERMQIFNVGTGQGITVREMVRAFEETAGVRVPTEIAARRAGDLPRFFADAARARDMLGWMPSRDLHDMCLDAWGWQSRNPGGYDAQEDAA